MSLNPALGHLYTDDSISNALTSLDVKEHMRTRVINAREIKYLDKFTKTLDLAKDLCKRRNEWEQRDLRRDLTAIEWKTPSLNQSLQIESERQNSFRPSQSTLGLVLPKVSATRSVVSNGKVESNETQRKPVTVSAWSVYYHNVPQTRAGLSRHGSTKSLDNTFLLRRLSSIHCDNESKSSGFIKKAEQVTKSLHKLYTQSSERKELRASELGSLSKSSIEELEKALFVLRGSEAGNFIEETLKRKGHVVKTKDSGNTFGNKNEGAFVSAKANSLSNVSNAISNSENDANGVSLDNCETQYSLIYGKKKSDTATRSESNESSETCSDSKLFPAVQKATTARNFLNVDEIVDGEFSSSTSMTSSASSESECGGGITMNMRWTDIFRAPALWKRQTRENMNKSPKTKNVSLVTLTGKTRSTMLKRR